MLSSAYLSDSLARPGKTGGAWSRMNGTSRQKDDKMKALTYWDPFRELEDMQHRLSTVLGRQLNRRQDADQESITVAEWAPVVDIIEDETEYLIKVDLPEIKKEEVKVTVENGVLVLSGERILSGPTKMETTTQVYDLSTRSRQMPLFTFSTSGGSNAEPGIITSVGPFAPTTVPLLVISVAGKGAHGVSEDAKRTARVIAAYISEQLVARGYLPADKKAGRAKRPGEL